MPWLWRGWDCGPRRQKGISLEGMDGLFEGKWYLVWKARVSEPAFVGDGTRSSNEVALGDKEAGVMQLERV